MNEDIAEVAEHYGVFFAGLTPEDLDQLADFFAQDARFKDPFNDVRGIPAIRQVFEHMFAHCPAPRFTVHEVIVQGQTAYFHWQFVDRGPDDRGGIGLDVDGVSRVLFDAKGKVLEHIDYWDAAEHLYARLPVIGWLLARIRARISAA